MKKKVSLVVCAIAVTSFLAFAPVLAEEEKSDDQLTPEQIGLIYMNCNSAKNQLKRLQTTEISQIFQLQSINLKRIILAILKL